MKRNPLDLPHIADTPIAPAVGVAAIALSLAIQWFDMTVVKDGVMYQQKKMEGVVFKEVGFADVLAKAKEIEAYLMSSPNRVSAFVFEALENSLAQEESLGKFTIHRFPSIEDYFLRDIEAHNLTKETPEAIEELLHKTEAVLSADGVSEEDLEHLDDWLVSLSDDEKITLILKDSDKGYAQLVEQCPKGGPDNTSLMDVLADLVASVKEVGTSSTSDSDQALQIVPIKTNDSNGYLWSRNPEYYNTGVKLNVLDLSQDTTKFGYGIAHHTDLIAPGGQIDSVILAITFMRHETQITEYFEANVSDNSGFKFASENLNKRHNQTISMPGSITLQHADVQYDGSESVFAESVLKNTQSMRVSFRLRVDLNLQTGWMTATGYGSDVVVVDRVDVVAFKPKLYFSK